MELVGRLTADAKVSTLKNERKVVNFSIAINDSYKPKGSEMLTKITTFVNCSYWINPAIAEHLTKSKWPEDEINFCVCRIIFPRPRNIGTSGSNSGRGL
jgi:hypothetical protein